MSELSGAAVVHQSIAQQGTIVDIDADVTAIMAVTDLLPDAGALTSILDETNKIDEAATDGLSGTSNSLAYRVEEIEKHLHSRGRFWGALAAPDETNAIEANVDRPFVAVSGNNTWGAAIPICGTDDVPIPSGLVSFDAHRLLVVDLDDDTTPWRIRFIFGTGTSAAAISAEQWSEEMIESNAVPGNRAGGVPLNFQMMRIDIGVKMWCQVWNDTNLEELSFFWGAHGYAG